MLAYRETRDDALVPPPPDVCVKFAARVLMLRALVVPPAALLVLVPLLSMIEVVVALATAAFLLCVGTVVCCVCNHTLAESKGCPTRVPVIPAAYPDKMELRTEMEEQEVLVESEAMADAVYQQWKL